MDKGNPEKGIRANPRQGGGIWLKNMQPKGLTAGFDLSGWRGPCPVLGQEEKEIAMTNPLRTHATSYAHDTDQAIVESGLRTLDLESKGLHNLATAIRGPLGNAFVKAVLTLKAVKGRIIVSGMGKSGHIGRKIAATMASTGTPAFFVHPGEASHGDLGMITPDDAILALSWSGETLELRDMIHHAHRFNVPLVALTSNGDSALGKAATVALTLPKSDEACPHGLAPTTSTTMQLAIGDALAVALLESGSFTASDFRIFHPGGKLGAGLTFVRDVMHGGARTPLVKKGTRMGDAILEMSKQGVGCVGVEDGRGHLAGIITDGDLRRHMGAGLLDAPVEAIMSANPRTVRPDVIASEALNIMNASKITALFVVDNGKPVGVLHVHDMLKIGVA
jgi:arabinose-5-phosphate isomerase